MTRPATLRMEEELCSVAVGPDRIDRWQIGRYRVSSILAQGGSGVVYRVHDPELGRDVALKVLRRTSTDDVQRRRFEREVRLLSSMNSPSIVPVLDVGEDDGQPYFTMPLVEGPSLADVISALRRRGVRADRVTVDDLRAVGVPEAALAGTVFDCVVRWIRDAAQALEAAHAHGILHRDVQPANLLITPVGHVQWIDFGLAIHEQDETLTRADVQIGSLAYMSPEVGRSEKADVRTDVYGLGALLYALLTFEPIHPGDRISRVLAHVLHEEPVPAHWYRSDLPRDLRVVLAAALATERSQRYSTCHALAEDLERVLARRPIQMRSPGPIDRLVRFTRAHRLWTAALVTMFVALASGLGISSTAWREANEMRGRSNRAYENERVLTEEQDRLLQDQESLLAEADRLAFCVDVHELEDYLDSSAPWTGDERAAMQDWERRVARLTEEHARVQTLVADSSSAFIAEQMTEVAPIVERLAAASGAMADRLEFAATLDQESILKEPQAWRDAVRRVREHPAYAGLELTPRPGLLPLGPDPSSGLEEFWHVRTGEAPVRRKDGTDWVIGPGTAIVLVLIPGGRDVLGMEPLAEEERDTPVKWSDYYLPLREVEVAPFFLAKYELTRGQWSRLRGLEEDVADGDVAVNELSYRELLPVLRRIGLDLPDEDRWEYAARAGLEGYWPPFENAEEYRRGANLHPALFSVTWTIPARPPTDPFADVAPVGRFAPNGFGLHDMLGNLTEWCRRLPHPTIQFAEGRESVRGGCYAQGPWEVPVGGRFIQADHVRLRAFGARACTGITGVR